MKVAVTDWCIQNGIPYNCGACPIALALKKAGASFVLVWSEYHTKNPTLQDKKSSSHFSQGYSNRGKTRDMMKEMLYIEIHLRFLYNGVWFHVKAPKQVEQFILKFDHKPSGLNVTPFEFDLHLS